jgi:hypothetical protein
MEHTRTWREILSASSPCHDDELNLYWPFGFPEDFLIYCRHFIDTSLQKQFPWCRSPCLPSLQPSIFLTCSPLYIIQTATSDKPLEEAKELENQSGNEDDDVVVTAPTKRLLAPTYRSVRARDAARHLFARQPPAQATQVEEQRSAIELYAKIKTAIGGVGMASYIIRSLVSRCGTYMNCMNNRHRNGLLVAARIFGLKRRRLLFPYFIGLHHSVPQQSSLASAIQVCQTTVCSPSVPFPQAVQATARSYLKSGSNPTKVQSAVKTGNVCLVAAMLDSGVTADSRLFSPCF